MATGREKWDRRIVPEGPRKKAPTASKKRGGKAATVSQSAVQLDLLLDIADSPQGNVSALDADQSAPDAAAVYESRTEQPILPSMTLEEVASIDNLREAFQRVRSNQGAPGPDRQTVNEVQSNLSTILPAVHRALLGGSYRPGLVRRVWIPKPGGQRGLGIPNVVDRMVSQAVHQILSPHYEPTFHDSSHGFRPGRSCHTAIAEAQTYLEEGREWMVDLDLSKFFDRVNHERLLRRLSQRIADVRLLRLIRMMLKAKVVLPDGVVVKTDEGTPQGGPLSPLLSNIVLDELDWEISRRGHRFVRYADDTNIYVSSERSGQRVMESITRFIEQRLLLQVNQGKSAVAQPGDRHFLGFRTVRSPESGAVEIHLSKRSRARINERIRELTPRNWGRKFSDCIEGLNQYLTGWINYFSICTVAGAREFQQLDAHIRRRLRAIVLKQWKSRATIARRLIRMGVGRKAVGRVLYDVGRKRLWALTDTRIIDRSAMPKAWFAEQGLVSLRAHWEALSAHQSIDPKPVEAKECPEVVYPPTPE